MKKFTKLFAGKKGRKKALRKKATAFTLTVALMMSGITVFAADADGQEIGNSAQTAEETETSIQGEETEGAELSGDAAANEANAADIAAGETEEGTDGVVEEDDDAEVTDDTEETQEDAAGGILENIAEVSDGKETGIKDEAGVLDEEAEERAVEIIYGYISKVNGVETGTKESEGYFAPGTELEITAEKVGVDVSFQFTRWISDEELEGVDLTQEVITVKVPEGEYTFTLVGEGTAVDENGNSAINVSMYNGEILEANGKAYSGSEGYFPRGAKLTISAPAQLEDGREFVKWSASAPYGYDGTFEDERSHKTVYTVTNEDGESVILSANYKSETVSVSVAGGWVLDGEEKVDFLEVPADTEITLVGDPGSDDTDQEFEIEFQKWTVGGKVIEGAGETCTYTVDGEEDYLSFAACYKRTGKEDNLSYTKLTVRDGVVTGVNGTKCEEAGGTFYYPAGTILDLRSDEYDWGPGPGNMWSQRASGEEFSLGIFLENEGGYARYIVPEQGHTTLTGVQMGSSLEEIPALTTVVNGVVTAVDGVELEEPTNTINMGRGKTCTLKAEKPADDDEYTYVFHRWMESGTYGLYGEFSDPKSETTEYKADTNTVIFAEYTAIPKTGKLVIEDSNGMTADENELAASVLTPADKAKMLKGETVEVTLDAADVSKEAIEAENPAILDAIEEGGWEFGQAYDLTVKKGEAEMESLFYPVRFTVSTEPTDAEQAMLRYHDGEIDILPDLDTAKDTITFETDRFSYYVAIHKPESEEPTDPEDPDKPDPEEPVDPEPEKPENPDDGKEQPGDGNDGNKDNGNTGGSGNSGINGDNGSTGGVGNKGGNGNNGQAAESGNTNVSAARTGDVSHPLFLFVCVLLSGGAATLIYKKRKTM